MHPLTAAVYEPCGVCEDTRCSWCLGGCACGAPVAHYAWELPDDVEDESSSASEPDDGEGADADAGADETGEVIWPQLRRRLQLRGGAPHRRAEAGGSMDSVPGEQASSDGELAGLLDELNAAVDSGASEMECGRLANAIALRLAVRRPLAATRKAIIAASHWIRVPERYNSAETCRVFFNAGRSTTSEWRIRLADALAAEAAAAQQAAPEQPLAPAPRSPQTASSSSGSG